MSSKEYATRARIIRILRAIAERPYGYTIAQLAERYGVSTDTIRGDFTVLQNADFVIDRDERNRYALVEDKPLKQLRNLLHFTEEDQVLLDQAIDRIAANTPQGQRLKKKLAALYDFRKLGHAYLSKPYLRKLDALLQAIGEKKQVVLEGYHSTASNTIGDRRVEPFHVSPSDDILHAYDLERQEVRHFRISRFGRVRLQDAPWAFERRHVVLPTDPFRIVDPKQVDVRLQIRVGGYNGLVEAFPLTQAYFREIEPEIFELRCAVNHAFLGLGQFLLGHHEQIVSIEAPAALRVWLQGHRERMDF